MKKLLLLGMVAFAPDVVGSDTLKTLPTVAVKVSHHHIPFKRIVDATVGEKTAWALAALVNAGLCYHSVKELMVTQDANTEDVYVKIATASGIMTVLCTACVCRA